MSPYARAGIVAVFVAILTTLVVGPNAEADEAWTATGSMHVSRGDPALAVLQDGRVLAAGGWDYAHGTNLASAEVYYPASGTWSLTASMPHVHRGAAAVRLEDGRVLVAGGSETYLPYQRHVDTFNPATAQWQTSPQMLRARGRPSATRLPDGRVFVIGDADSSSGGYPAEIFDPTTETWALTSPPGSRRYRETSTLLLDGRVLVAGGYSSGSPVGAEVYDPASDTWTPTGPLVVERYGHTATPLPDGRVMIVAGSAGASAEIYDPATNEWTPAGSLAVARLYHSAAALADGRVMVTGGLTQPMAQGNSVEILDPVTGLASPGPSLLETRYAHRAVRLESDRILVAGGKRVGCELLADVVDDTAPPSVQLLNPLEQETVSGVVTMTADAQDDTGIVRVDFYDGAALISSAVAPPYEASWDTTTAASGPHPLKARAFDTVGRFTDSATRWIVVRDVTAPQVSIKTPTEGETVSGVVAISANATDPSGIEQVDFVVDGYLIDSTTAQPYAVSWDTSGWSLGEHVLEAGARDPLGNEATSAPVVVTIVDPGADTVYDPELRAPRCAAGVAVCDSGNLLVGRRTLGPEPHQPNTIGASCPDGAFGSFHSDESLDRLVVSTTNGLPLTAGTTVTIAATVWAWSGFSSDKLDLFHAADASAPQWVHIGRLTPQAAGSQVLSTTYVLPEGALQAVRARFSYNSTSVVACAAGSYNDHDDIVCVRRGPGAAGVRRSGTSADSPTDGIPLGFYHGFERRSISNCPHSVGRSGAPMPQPPSVLSSRLGGQFMWNVQAR